MEEVIAYIDAAISEAVKKAHECNDVDTIAKWRSIPGAGDMPTAVELISYLGDAVMYIS